MSHKFALNNISKKSKLIIQPKLMINPPGDPYELEANAVAERVMRMPADSNQCKPVTGIIGSSIQRKCAACEEQEKKKIMRKTESNGDYRQASPSFLSSLASSQGTGSPLPGNTKNFMENAFSTDFSDVRIHTDRKASEMNNGINARAFTYGSDIYFNHGEFVPQTKEGKKLLAHELTHTIQQSREVQRMFMLQRRSGPSRRASSRQATISDIRREAMSRVSVAYLNINGTSQNFSMIDELRRVRELIAPDIVNFEQIVRIVGSILSKLSSDSNIVIGPEIQECRGRMGWNAYVTNNSLPIHLCERFFGKPREEQIRTLIHEAAHAAGFGQAAGETYFPLFDCSASSADNWNVADAWARYIHCIGGRTPDSPQPVRARPRRR